MATVPCTGGTRNKACISPPFLDFPDRTHSSAVVWTVAFALLYVQQHAPLYPCLTIHRCDTVPEERVARESKMPGSTRIRLTVEYRTVWPGYDRLDNRVTTRFLLPNFVL